MASADIVFEVDSSQVDLLEAGLQRALSPTSIEGFLLTKAAGYLQEITGINFAHETSRDGQAWEPLHDATNAIREQDGYSPEHPINERTGELREWLTNSHGDVAPGLDGAELTWPSEGDPDAERKLQVAQQGSKRGENPLFPSSATNPRPVIGAGEVDLAILLALLGDHLISSLGGGSNIADLL